MAIVLRLRNPALEEQGENANRFEKGLARTINSFREPGMYLTVMVDVGRTTVPSHDLLELVGGYSRRDLVCSLYPACPFVSEKTSSKTKHICFSAQRNFHFDCFPIKRASWAFWDLEWCNDLIRDRNKS